MDGICEGNSTSKPPLLDEENYGYWKSRIEAFLMSLGMRKKKTTQPRTSSSSSSRLYRRKCYEQGEKDFGTSESGKNGKGIRCHECEEFGHIQSECATYLKRKKKSLIAMFSDEENYCESNDEEVGMTLISISTINKEEVERVHP
ncbi:uncharacterized protein E6C27_scaffold84G00970 [Cucumis melo var. makuwa]|uniref:Gag-pol polyprotein n=1 Tax=Cucumis melo var. makuwa TaxID=1194695 RepID=A0A5A7T6Y4_CUCMM|nr:uncharacterized protein E6C27_scaffold84G00970 [Cucumis melo var. makuwa]